MSAVICSNISKRFQDKHQVVDALLNINLEIEEGEFLMLLGPPSSGKSTLLSILGGLTKQDSGECRIFSEDLFKMSDKERTAFRRENIGFVFQNLHLISSLTAYENILLPLEFAGVPKKTAKVQANELFYQLGIENKRNYYPSKLSQGENQLVALARALAARPRLLLLNEPTSFLDHSSGVRVMTLLRQMVIDQMVTVISITNDVRLQPFANRLVRMKGGEIVSIVGEAMGIPDASPFLKI